MGEFQVTTPGEQDLLIDTTLASALVAYRGDVVLLLPVLRPDVRAMWGHPEFVAKVHEFVSARSHDPKFRRAFASNTPLRESLARLDTSGPTTSAVASSGVKPSRSLGRSVRGRSRMVASGMARDRFRRDLDRQALQASSRAHCRGRARIETGARDHYRASA